MEAKRSVEAACAAVEKQKLQCEVAKCKQMMAAQNKVGMIVEALASGSSICARCSLKVCPVIFYPQLANDSPPGITCVKKGVGHQSACKACHINKVKCEWITGSHADSEEGGRVVASLS